MHLWSMRLDDGLTNMHPWFHVIVSFIVFVFVSFIITMWLCWYLWKNEFDWTYAVVVHEFGRWTNK